MKKLLVILAAALLLSVSSENILAQKRVDGNILTKDAVRNYLFDLTSNNEGVRISSAYFLGEYKVGEAVIPLMKMLNSEANEQARIVAALSLTKIKTGKAVYAVKQASILDNSQRVRNLCTRFYLYIISEDNDYSGF
jgi:HEAT repeat protein